MKKLCLATLLLAVAVMGTACTKTENSSSVAEVSESVDNSSVSQEESDTESTSATTENTTTTTTESATTATTTASIAEPEPVEPDVWNPYIPQRQILLDEGCMAGVIFIGGVDYEMDEQACVEAFLDTSYAENYELKDFPVENVVDAGGYELYLIFPFDENASVSVNEWLFTEENDYAGESGEVLYRSEVGAPILLRCNVSDIMSNSVVNIVDSEGNTLSWSPSISLKDGTVWRSDVTDRLYDFTEYEPWVYEQMDE